MQLDFRVWKILDEIVYLHFEIKKDLLWISEVIKFKNSLRLTQC
jgi:hypothetical protein